MIYFGYTENSMFRIFQKYESQNILPFAGPEIKNVHLEAKNNKTYLLKSKMFRDLFRYIFPKLGMSILQKVKIRF